MKKLIIVLLLVALMVPCAFAEEEAASDSGLSWDVIDSVSLHGAFDHISMRGKFFSHEVTTSKMTGFGFGFAVEFDLSEIPNFMKKGWYGYFDMDFIFPGTAHFHDTKYNKENSSGRFGLKSHIGIMRDFEFGIPFATRIGAGFAYNLMRLKPDSSTVSSSRAIGFSLLGEATYTFGEKFGVTLAANVDMSFVTRSQQKIKDSTGGATMKRHTAFGFGLDFAVNAGFKFIM